MSKKTQLIPSGKTIILQPNTLVGLSAEQLQKEEHRRQEQAQKTTRERKYRLEHCDQPTALWRLARHPQTLTFATKKMIMLNQLKNRFALLELVAESLPLTGQQLLFQIKNETGTPTTKIQVIWSQLNDYQESFIKTPAKVLSDFLVIYDLYRDCCSVVAAKELPTAGHLFYPRRETQENWIEILLRQL